MKLKKTIPLIIDCVGRGFKIIWRLLWLFFGVNILWKEYLQIQKYLDMDSVFVLGLTIYEGERLSALPQLCIEILVSVVIALYALFYAITGRLRWRPPVVPPFAPIHANDECFRYGMYPGQSICVGAWSDYLDGLEENAFSECLNQMAEETNLSVDILQNLRAYARRPALIKSFQEDYAEIIFHAQKPTKAENTFQTDSTPISSEGIDRIQRFVFNGKALSLLFQPLPLFVVTADEITIHRTAKQAVLYAADTTTSGSDVKIYDALGYEYQPLSDSDTPAAEHAQKLPLLVPAYPDKTRELANALQTYLAEQSVVLPSEPKLSSLVSMAVCRLDYTQA